MFTGDGINCHLWMQLDHSLPMKEFKKNLEGISWVKEKADRILMYNPDAIGQWLVDKYP